MNGSRFQKAASVGATSKKKMHKLKLQTRKTLFELFFFPSVYSIKKNRQSFTFPTLAAFTSPNTADHDGTFCFSPSPTTSPAGLQRWDFPQPSATSSSSIGQHKNATGEDVGAFSKIRDDNDEENAENRDKEEDGINSRSFDLEVGRTGSGRLYKKGKNAHHLTTPGSSASNSPAMTRDRKRLGHTRNRKLATSTSPLTGLNQHQQVTSFSTDVPDGGVGLIAGTKNNNGSVSTAGLSDAQSTAVWYLTPSNGYEIDWDDGYSSERSDKIAFLVNHYK